MAYFGVPGGWEAAAILSIVVMLFFPAIVVFGAGFLFGKKAAAKRAESDTSAPKESKAAPDGEVPVAAPAETSEPTDGDADV